MRKKLLVVITILLVAITATMIVACGEDKPTTVTVTFEGESVSIQPQTVKSGNTIVQPMNPVREGYTFECWLKADGTAFDFSLPVNENLTLTAKWKEIVPDTPDTPDTPDNPNTPIVPIEDGTAEHPYIIDTADELVDFADRVNHPEEEGNETYYKSHFKLGADIDMNGVSYVSAGQVVVLNEGEENEETIYGFSGNFNGNGHKISNLSLMKNLRSSMYYIGFFGVTDRANIYDLTLEDIYYEIEAGADNTNIGAYYGGLVGYASLTNFTNIKVTGVMETRLLPNNPAYIGGIAGAWEINDSEVAYIGYAENCYVDIETKIGEYDDGEKCYLGEVINGGLFGYVSNYNGAVAIVNSVANGKVYGGKWVGGIAAYLSSSYVSIINCVNHANVTATATSGATYVGGIVGYSYGDNTIMDSYSTGRIKGVRASSTSTYKTYVGGVAGFATEDDYEIYYTAGLAVLNCYYTDNISTYDVKNTVGTAKATDFTFTEDWVVENLNWESGVMSFDDNNKATPNAKVDNNGKIYTLSYYSDGEVVKTVEKKVEDTYAIIGTQESLAHKGDGILFYSWEHESDVPYRFYVPVVKDMSLTARWQDVSGILGVYTGTGTLYETMNAGIIVFMEDGTLQWVNSNATNGEFIFDGEHIIFELYNNIGTVSGQFDKDGKLTFVLDAGMSGSVSYEFIKSDLKIFGEYFADNGDILTFSGDTGISLHKSELNKGQTISGTYSLEDDVVTVTGGKLTDYYSEITITVNANLTLTVNAKGIDGKTTDMNNVVFSKYGTPDYSDKPFVGTYTFAMPSLSYDDKYPSYDTYTVVFNANGTFEYRSQMSTTLGSYHAFTNDTIIKVSLEGYISTFNYDTVNDIMYGYLNRGTSARFSIIITPESDGKQVAMLAGSETTVLYVTDCEKSYFVKDGEYQKDAVIVATSYSDGERITIDGVDYRIVATNDDYYGEGYFIRKIGEEEGTYQEGDNTVILNGIGNVSGTKSGEYYMYDDNLIVVLFEDDTFIGFDYKAAQNSDNNITVIEADGYQGVWYKSHKKTDNEGESYIVEKYYKFMIDGYGHAALHYFSDSEQKYTFVWTNTKFSDMTVTATGIYTKFNEVQEAEVVFYYDKAMAYSKDFGYLDEAVFTVDGYTGVMTPPVLPSTATGSYNGQESGGMAVVLNLKSDLTGTYKGQPFSAIYDGDKLVIFELGGVTHTFNIETRVITYGNESVTLTLGGAVTEVIPAMLCGTWQGTFVGYGTNETRKIVIESAGTITYVQTAMSATYNNDTKTITGSTDSYDVTLVYNEDGDYFTVEVIYTQDEYDEYTFTCNQLTKVEQ